MTAHKNSIDNFEYGNQKTNARTAEGVVFDNSQLSEDEAQDTWKPTPFVAKESVRERVGTALRQRGVSPKVLGDLIVSVVSFVVLLITGVPVSVELAAGIAKAAGFAAGFLIGPGDVVVDVEALTLV